MTPARALLTWLESEPTSGGASVVGWRFEVVRGADVRVGVRDSRLGGPYEGPGAALRLGGNLDLHWSDGRLTRTSLDRRAVLDPAAELDAWRAWSVVERRDRLPTLAGPTTLPAVEVLDPALDRAVREAPSSCLDIPGRLLAGCASADVRRVDVVFRASSTEREIGTSAGFRAGWRETACSVSLWADETAGATYERRVLPDPFALDHLIGQVSALAPLLSQQAELPASAAGVLFMPRVVDDLLSRLLLPNLAGRAIRDGRSPFTRDDLAARATILRDDLDLVVDTTLPFALATAPCSSDGIPAGRAYLVEGGRWLSPRVDLATADELGLTPTPTPRGRPAALLASRSPLLELEAALARLGDGAIVRELPGLHTQSPRRMAYALVAPDAQAVVGGRAVGRCAVRVAGSLIEHLREPTTALVRLPGERGVGLLVLRGVALLPA